MSRVPFAELPDELPFKNNLVRTYYHSPEMFKDFGRLAMRVHTASRVATRQRELALMRVAARVGADFEWGSHVPGARAAGITDDELRGLRDGDFSLFAGKDLIAIRYAEAVDAGTVDDALWAEARAEYSDGELVDLTAVVTFYGMASRFVRALGVPPDDGGPGLEVP